MVFSWCLNDIHTHPSYSWFSRSKNRPETVSAARWRGAWNLMSPNKNKSFGRLLPLVTSFNIIIHVLSICRTIVKLLAFLGCPSMAYIRICPLGGLDGTKVTSAIDSLTQILKACSLLDFSSVLPFKAYIAFCWPMYVTGFRCLFEVNFLHTPLTHTIFSEILNCTMCVLSHQV